MTKNSMPSVRGFRRMNDVGFMLALTFGLVFGPIIAIDDVATFLDLSDARIWTVQ